MYAALGAVGNLRRRDGADDVAFSLAILLPHLGPPLLQPRRHIARCSSLWAPLVEGPRSAEPPFRMNGFVRQLRPACTPSPFPTSSTLSTPPVSPPAIPYPVLPIPVNRYAATIFASTPVPFWLPRERRPRLRLLYQIVSVSVTVDLPVCMAISPPASSPVPLALPLIR